jgi:hypothetical protein
VPCWPKNRDSFSDKRNLVFFLMDGTGSLSGTKRTQCETNYLSRFTVGVNNMLRHKGIMKRGDL